uniref:Uncharacterized protein n=1 Tax=Salix viminalis TaxID=40686 RepID=A0A6N2JXB6_SALVM
MSLHAESVKQYNSDTVANIKAGGLWNAKLWLLLSPFKYSTKLKLKTCAKFDLFEILGGRGLCNGEKGVQQELKRNIEEQASSIAGKEENSGSLEKPSVADDAFEKELMGLTGGFPGGEKGLKKFIEENPPPKKQ